MEKLSFVIFKLLSILVCMHDGLLKIAVCPWLDQKFRLDQKSLNRDDQNSGWTWWPEAIRSTKIIANCNSKLKLNWSVCSPQWQQVAFSYDKHAKTKLTFIFVFQFCTRNDILVSIFVEMPVRKTFSRKKSIVFQYCTRNNTVVHKIFSRKKLSKLNQNWFLFWPVSKIIF